MAADQSAEVLRSWRGLYKAALFETDASKLPLRIEEARRELVSRSRELFAASPNCDGEAGAIEMHSMLSTPLYKIGHKRIAGSASLLEFCPHVSDGEVLA